MVVQERQHIVDALGGITFGCSLHAILHEPAAKSRSVNLSAFRFLTGTGNMVVGTIAFHFQSFRVSPVPRNK